MPIISTPEFFRAFKLNVLKLVNIASSVTPPVGKTFLYVKTDKKLYYQDSDGNEREVIIHNGTQTVTNKRVTLRAGTITSHATPTINTDNVDFFTITAQAEAITSMTTNLSGTPTIGQKLIIQITGTAARAITWGNSFEASTVALPTTTVTTTMLSVGFIWNSITSKWNCVATA